jgi:hypothetical protein
VSRWMSISTASEEAVTSSSGSVTHAGISTIVAGDVIHPQIGRSHVTLPGSDHQSAFRAEERAGLLPVGHGLGSGAAQTPGTIAAAIHHGDGEAMRADRLTSVAQGNGVGYGGRSRGHQ